MRFSYIDNLVVETSRRCNARCAHCLRGDSQNLSISQKVLDAFLDGCTDELRIGTLSIGGGEPALSVPEIALTRKSLAKRNASFQSFYLVTSGFVTQDQIMDLIRESVELWCASEDKTAEIFGLALSHDTFHPEIERQIPMLLSALGFFRPNDKAVQNGQPQYLHREGRAKHLPDDSHRYILSDIDPSRTKFENVELESDGDNPGIYAYGGDLYLCANGNIVNCCDFSYDHMDKEPICSVFDTDWPSKWYAAAMATMAAENA